MAHFDVIPALRTHRTTQVRLVCGARDSAKLHSYTKISMECVW